MDLISVIRNRLFQKQFLSYFLLFIIVVSIIGYLIFTVANDIIRQQTENLYQMSLDGLKNNVDSRLRDIENLNIRLFGTQWFKKTMYMYPHIDPERLNMYDFMSVYSELSNYKANNNLIEEIFLYFKNDDFIISSYGSDNIKDFFKMEFKVDEKSQDYLYKRLRNSVISEAVNGLKIKYLQKEFDGLVLMRSPSDEKRATIVTVVKRQNLEKIISTMNGSVFILDKDDKIVASSNMGLMNDAGLYRFDLYKEQNGIFKRNIDGETYIICYNGSDIYNWKYVTLIPIQEIMQKARYFRNVFFLLILLSALIGFVTNIFLTKKSLAPVRRIVSILDTMDLDSKHARDSDFDVIERSINNLYEEKNTLEDEIEKYNPITKNSYLIRLLKCNENDIDQVLSVLLRFSVEFPKKYFNVCIFEVEYEDYVYRESGWQITEIMVVLHEVLDNILNECLLAGNSLACLRILGAYCICTASE